MVVMRVDIGVEIIQITIFHKAILFAYSHVTVSRLLYQHQQD